MKKVFFVLMMLASSMSFAQHRHGYHGHYHHHHGSNLNWIAPALIGGAVVYMATRPAPPQPPTVIYVPPTLPQPPLGYRYEQILDANCNCYRWVLIQG